MEGTVVVDWFCLGAPISALPREDSHVGGHESHHHPATIRPKRATQEPTTSDWEKQVVFQASFLHLVWFSKGRCKGLFFIRSSTSNSCTHMGSSRDREVRPSLLWTLSPAASQAGRAISLPFRPGLKLCNLLSLCFPPQSSLACHRPMGVPVPVRNWERLGWGPRCASFWIPAMPLAGCGACPHWLSSGGQCSGVNNLHAGASSCQQVTFYS